MSTPATLRRSSEKAEQRPENGRLLPANFSSFGNLSRIQTRRAPGGFQELEKSRARVRPGAKSSLRIHPPTFAGLQRWRDRPAARVPKDNSPSRAASGRSRRRLSRDSSYISIAQRRPRKIKAKRRGVKLVHSRLLQTS